MTNTFTLFFVTHVYSCAWCVSFSLVCSLVCDSFIFAKLLFFVYMSDFYIFVCGYAMIYADLNVCCVLILCKCMYFVCVQNGCVYVYVCMCVGVCGCISSVYMMCVCVRVCGCGWGYFVRVRGMFYSRIYWLLMHAKVPRWNYHSRLRLAMRGMDWQVSTYVNCNKKFPLLQNMHQKRSTFVIPHYPYFFNHNA